MVAEIFRGVEGWDGRVVVMSLTSSGPP